MAAAKTIDTAKAIELVKQAVAANKGGDPVKALELAKDGRELYDGFRFPAGQGKTATFDDLVDTFREIIAAQKAAATPEPAPAAVEAAPVQKAQTDPAPAPAASAVLTITHDGKAPTSITGVEKGSAGVKVLGKGGLKWLFTTKPGVPTWYLPKTGGYAPDMDAIEEAAEALAAVGYTVESNIVTKDEQGNDLPAKPDPVAMAEWQRRYTAADQLGKFQLSMGQGECVTCDRTGLTVVDGRMTRDAEKIPQVQCATCTGEAVEDLGVTDLLALPSTPSPVPASEECPACRQRQPLDADGKIKLHSKPFIGGACSGKAPVADVEPEPKAAPARKAAAPKAAPAAVAAIPSEADDAAALAAATADVEARKAALTEAMTSGSGLLEAAQALQVATEAAAVTERMAADNAAKRAAAAKAAEAAKVAAKPEAAAPAAAGEVVGMSYKFRMIAGASGMQLKDSATQYRSDLAKALAKTGVRVEVRKSKSDKTLVAVVMEAPEGVDVKALASVIRTVGLSQRGVISGTKVA